MKHNFQLHKKSYGIYLKHWFQYINVKFEMSLSDQLLTHSQTLTVQWIMSP